MLRLILRFQSPLRRRYDWGRFPNSSQRGPPGHSRPSSFSASSISNSAIWKAVQSWPLCPGRRQRKHLPSRMHLSFPSGVSLPIRRLSSSIGVDLAAVGAVGAGGGRTAGGADWENGAMAGAEPVGRIGALGAEAIGGFDEADSAWTSRALSLSRESSLVARF